MGKLLRISLLLSVIFSLLVSIPSSPARAEAPIAPGTWTGYFTRDIHASNVVGDVAIDATGHAQGDLNLVVNNDGSVTGKIENYKGEFKWVIIPTSLSPGGHCKFNGAFDVTGGTVTMNPAHLPVFDLQIKVTARTMDCDPKPPGGPDTNPSHSVHFESKTYSGGKITGDLIRFENDMIDAMIIDVAKVGGEMTVTEYWELNSKSSVVTLAEPEPEYVEYFLTGVHLMNSYWTSVDWHDTPPGTVEFTLATATHEAVPNELGFPSATFELMQLPPGKTPLTATAIGADGQIKDSKSIDVTMVPQEPWALKAGFEVAETKPYDLWKVVIYRGKTFVPDKPITLPYLDLSAIPVIGGKWGMEKPFQAVINLEATSKGGLSNPAPVTGDASLFLGDNDHPLKLTVKGQTVTNMTESALLFDHGNMNFVTTPLSYKRNIGLVDLIPAAQAFYQIPGLGSIFKWLNSNGLGIELKVSVDAKGQGDLGLPADHSQLIFTKGSITPSIAFLASAGILPDPIKIAVGGGGKGTFQIRIAPTTGLENCWVSLKFTVQGFGQSYDSPDYGIAQCKTAMIEGHRVFITYRPGTGPNEFLQPILPYDSQLNAYRNSQAQPMPNTTILVSGVSPEASLDLASAPNGRMAFVYTTGKQGQVGVKLFDGKAWGNPITLGDDKRINMHPVAAFDASGKVVVAWSMPAAGALPALTKFDTFLRTWEVAYAILDKDGKVIDQKSLTQDDQPDFFPQLERSTNGTLWLAWLKSPSVDLWGAKGNPNWLQATSWDGKGWSSVETISKGVLGAMGIRVAAGNGKDVSIVASQDIDGDPKTITDQEIYLYQHSGNKWLAPQRLTNDKERDVFPLVAYTAGDKLVVAWQRGKAVVGLEGDLKGTPVIWNIGSIEHTPDLMGGELLAGANGELAFLWSSFTENGQGVWLAQRPSTGTDWQPARVLADGLQGIGMLSAQLAQNGNLQVGLSQLHTQVEAQDVPGLGKVSLSGLPTSSDLAVLDASGVMHPLSGTNANPGNAGTLALGGSKMPPLLLVGAVGFGVLVILGIVALQLVRRFRLK